jgi:hypothetical protein
MIAQPRGSRPTDGTTEMAFLGMGFGNGVWNSRMFFGQIGVCVYCRVGVIALMAWIPRALWSLMRVLWRAFDELRINCNKHFKLCQWVTQVMV